VFDFLTNTDITPTLPRPKIHSSNFSPEVTLNYTPTDDLTVFGSLKKGYKSGSFKVAVPAVRGENNSFDDERVMGGEIGIKSRLLDRSLLANIAGYYYEYKGLQVGGIEPAPNGVPVIRTVNAGAARTYGVDFDLAYRPQFIEGLSINGSVNWNNARYTELNNIGCYANQTISQGCVNFPNPASLDPGTGRPRFTAQELSGTPMIRAPEWTANLGFDYAFPVGSDLKLRLNNNNQFSTRYVTYPAVGRPNNDNYQRGFVKVDASVALTGPEDRWEVALIGKNITDKITTSNCSATNFAGGLVLGGDNAGGAAPSAAGVAQSGCYTDAGRSVWVRFTFRPFN
jgi:outer membrane receptor protein involved in Fe transport